jgi:hypothetical protein
MTLTTRGKRVKTGAKIAAFGFAAFIGLYAPLWDAMPWAVK